MLLYYILFLTYYVPRGVRCEGVPLDLFLKMDTSFIAAVLREHYRAVDSPVHVRVRNGNYSSPTPLQADLIEDMTCWNSDWMVVAFSDLPPKQQRAAYYSVFLALDYDSLCALLDEMTYETHHFYGLYTIFVEQLADREILTHVMRKLWNVSIMNVVVIVEDNGEYVAYSYHPYRENRCGIVEPYVAGRYENGTWTNLDDWFPDRLLNLHCCFLTVGVVEVKPYSMLRLEDNRTIHYGLEVYIAETIASRMNFSIRYVQPKDHIKWGILHPSNSTGLVGMLQRNEADFGFGSLGFSLSRYTYLKMSAPSHLTQMIMAIPPKRPYTSLEKLFQPFTIDAWLCIAIGYAAFGVVTLILVRFSRGILQEHLRHPLYTLWVLLMGGSGARWRLNSTRLFLIGFILNALVIRTLYQAGMFQRLQSSASLASDLDTISAINKAGLHYNMFRSTLQFYKDNPMVPVSRIKVVQNDQQEWDDLFYDLSRDRLGGVMVSPLDCVAYYVKRRGKYGVVYLGKNTGFTYNLGVHYPKTTPLQGPFDAWILRLHATGLVRYWTEEFRDNRYWTNAKEDPEPASLKWNQISGGFALCGTLLALAGLVFLGELIHYRLCNSRLGSDVGRSANEA
uniref:Putative ionotropic receptor ligand binding domain-containing protein n=1 Tax=Anopheles dirus TaxID=7168 RepID=A0A1Y9H2B7_9DIPT